MLAIAIIVGLTAPLPLALIVLPALPAILLPTNPLRLSEEELRIEN
jgi:hypothetical protein